MSLIIKSFIQSCFHTLPFTQFLLESSGQHVLYTISPLVFINYQINHSNVSFLVITDPKRVIFAIHILYKNTSYHLILPSLSLFYFESNQVTPEPFQESTRIHLPKVPCVIIPYHSREPGTLNTPTIAPPPLLVHFKHISVANQRLPYPSLRSHLPLRSLQTFLWRLHHH